MNLEALKKVKTANAEEHLRVVLQDVNIANNELNKILNSISNAQEILKSYNDRIEGKSKEFAQISIQCDETLNRTKLIESKVIKANEDLVAKQREFDKGKETRLFVIKELDKKINQITNDYKLLVIGFENSIKEKRELIDKLESKYQLLVKDVNSSALELAKLNNEIQKTKEEKSILENELNRFVANSSKQREEIEKKIALELSTVENPRKLLKERETEVARRERDVGILIRRFRKEFGKLHPTLDPQI